MMGDTDQRNRTLGGGLDGYVLVRKRCWSTGTTQAVGGLAEIHKVVNIGRADVARHKNPPESISLPVRLGLRPFDDFCQHILHESCQIADLQPFS